MVENIKWGKDLSQMLKKCKIWNSQVNKTNSSVEGHEPYKNCEFILEIREGSIRDRKTHNLNGVLRH
jgi:hypothetical protein